jgi:hypothetical protein
VGLHDLLYQRERRRLSAQDTEEGPSIFLGASFREPDQGEVCRTSRSETPRAEAGIYVWEHYEEIAERAEREAKSYEKKYYRRGLWDRDPELEISDEKSHGEALSRARRMRSEQEDETATLGRTFARDADKANAFSKLSRYETTTERLIYRALHELERRQAGRSGAAPTTPQVLDVDVSGLAEGAG